MKKEMKDKENEDARKKLRELKERYELTWPEVAKIFGRGLGAVKTWYMGLNDIPKPYQLLINTYLDNPQVFKKHKDTINLKK